MTEKVAAKEHRPIVERIDTDDVCGDLHSATSKPVALLALTHGAGGNCRSPLIADVAQYWAAHGVTVLAFDLAFRRAKPSGPPHPSKASGDRESIVAAVRLLRGRASGPMLMGGHSYGGRQASMIAAEQTDVASGLVLFSYPLHPPGKPEKSRTAHLPGIRIPTLFVAGTKDPFGTPGELSNAITMVPSKTVSVEIFGAGHDLSAAKHETARVAFDAAITLFDLGS